MNFENDLKIVSQALRTFYDESVLAKRPVINQQNLFEVIEQLQLAKYARNGGLEGDALNLFLEDYLPANTRLHHPGYLGHQCAAPHYSAALGTFINGFTNNVASVYEMGPASAAIEYFIINWMLEKVGWERAPTRASNNLGNKVYGGGVLLDGGSIANLTALVIARSKSVPEVWTEGNPSGLSILLPSESHYSLTKAAGVLGLGSKQLCFVDVDDRGAIIPDRLPKSFQKAKELGFGPIALVANACSTAVGIYDPLDEIADFCQDNNLWFHVDGAHGASALLSDEHCHLLRGVERADSLVWDAHKLLQTPSLCAALLVKDHKYLDQGMKAGNNASYLFHEKDQPGVDFIHRTLETTKSGLGEKLFFVLGALGEKGLSDFIDRQYELTQRVYEYIDGLPDFECPLVPQSNILCFRYIKDGCNQLRLRNSIIERGNFYLTSTLFHGVRYLRLVFMNGQTTLEDIKKLIVSIRAICQR